MLVNDLFVQIPGTGDGKDLGRVLAATLSGLKEVRTGLVTACSEVDGKFKELEKFKEENAKLKYQIKHLKRSLEAEEAPLSAVSGCAL